MKLVKLNREALIWITALAGLYFLPEGMGHFTLCPIGALGFSWCPGCGIGHSIHHIMHFEWQQAFDHHYLGAFALLIILYRIFQLLFNPFKIKPSHHG